MDSILPNITKIGIDSVLDSPGNVLSPLPDTSQIISLPSSSSSSSFAKSSSSVIVDPSCNPNSDKQEEKENIPVTKECNPLPLTHSVSNQSTVSILSLVSPSSSSSTSVLGTVGPTVSSSSSVSTTTTTTTTATVASTTSSSLSSSSDKFEILRLKEQIQALKAELITTKAKCNALQSDNARLKMQLSRTNNSLGSSNNLNNARSRSNTAGTGGASSPLLHEEFYFLTSNTANNGVTNRSNNSTGGQGSTPVLLSSTSATLDNATGITDGGMTGTNSASFFLKDKFLQAIPRSSSMGTFPLPMNTTNPNYSVSVSNTVSSSSSPIPNTSTNTVNNTNTLSVTPPSSASASLSAWTSSVAQVYRERTGSIPSSSNGTENIQIGASLSPNSSNSITNSSTTFRMPTINFTKAWGLSAMTKEENNGTAKSTVSGTSESILPPINDENTEKSSDTVTTVDAMNNVMVAPVATKSSIGPPSASDILHTPIASGITTTNSIDNVPPIDMSSTIEKETATASIVPSTPLPGNTPSTNAAVGFTVSLSAFSQISGSLFAKPKSVTATPESTKVISATLSSTSPSTTATISSPNPPLVPTTSSSSTGASTSPSTTNILASKSSTLSSTASSSSTNGSWSNWFSSTFSLTSSTKEKFNINTNRLKLPVYQRQRSHSFIDLHTSMDHYLLQDLPNMVYDIDTRDANIIAKFSKLSSYSVGEIIPSSRMVYVVDGTVNQYPITATQNIAKMEMATGAATEDDDGTKKNESRISLPWTPSPVTKYTKGLVQTTNNASILASASSSTVCSVLPRQTLRILSWLARARAMEPTVLHDPLTILNRVKEEIQNCKTIQNYFYILQRNKDILNRIPLSHEIIVSSSSMEASLRQSLADLVRETGLYINGVLYTLGTMEKLADIIYHHLYRSLLTLTKDNVNLSIAIVKRLLVSSSRTVHGGDCMKFINDNFMNGKENFTFLAAETGGPTEIILQTSSIDDTAGGMDNKENTSVPPSSSLSLSTTSSLVFISLSAQNCFRMMEGTNPVCLFRCIVHEKITIPNILPTIPATDCTSIKEETVDPSVWLESILCDNHDVVRNDCTARTVDADSQMPPEQRIQFAMQNGMSPEILNDLENMAESFGMNLTGGRSSTLMGGGEGDDGIFEGGEDLIPISKTNLKDIISVTYDKAWSYGTTVAYYGAIPLILILMANRRGLSFGEMVKSIFRLPFTD